MNSIILNCLETEIIQLGKLCRFDLNTKWNLLYRASKDGFKISYFYARCKEHSPTLTIIKTTNNYVFGGYTKANWSCDERWVPDKSAYIFSLVNKWKKPKLMKIKDSNYAIQCNINFHLSFGDDIIIWDSSNTTDNSFSFLGSHYKYNYDKDIYYYPKEFLAGSHNFQVKEIEVFKEIQLIEPMSGSLN